MAGGINNAYLAGESFVPATEHLTLLNIVWKGLVHFVCNVCKTTQREIIKRTGGIHVHCLFIRNRLFLRLFFLGP